MLAAAQKDNGLAASLSELVDPDSATFELPSKKALANALHRVREAFKGRFRLRGRKNPHTEAVVWWVEQVATSERRYRRKNSRAGCRRSRQGDRHYDQCRRPLPSSFRQHRAPGR